MWGSCSTGRRETDRLNILLERQGADLQSKVEELEALNQSMRDRNKLKDDAIAHLSDQLIALTARLDSIEKRQ
jgi:predicted  nucleic acid-binding Zn-ribbon protein